MMQRLLHWLLRSPLHAGVAAAALALSRLLDVFGASLIALVALRKGFVPAVQAMAVALPLLLAAGYASGLDMMLAFAVLGLWAPVLMLSLVLRNTGSLALTLQSGAGLVGTVLLAWFVLDADPLGTVGGFLDNQVLPLLERMEGQSADLGEAQRDALARMTPGMMAAGSLVVMMLAVIVGRWWQAMAFNPGGFRRDFHRLRHGRSAALIATLLVFAAAFTGQQVVTGWALAGVVVLVFQGIALVHGVVAATGQPGFWLWAVYGLLVLLPLPATVLLAVAGGVDNWMDFRRLAGQDAVNSNEQRDRKGE